MKLTAFNAAEYKVHGVNIYDGIIGEIVKIDPLTNAVSTIAFDTTNLANRMLTAFSVMQDGS